MYLPSLVLVDCVPEETLELRDLTNLPIPRAYWRKLGSQLCINTDKLDEIQANCQHSPTLVEDCTRTMFHFWLNNGNSPTYKSLVEGLQAAGMDEAVTFIHQKYGKVLVMIVYSLSPSFFFVKHLITCMHACCTTATKYNSGCY